MKACEISRLLAEHIDVLAEHLLGVPNSKTHFEWRYGRKGSFAIAVAGDKRGSCFDHEQCKGGDALWLVQRLPWNHCAQRHGIGPCNGLDAIGPKTQSPALHLARYQGRKHLRVITHREREASGRKA